MKFTKIFRLPLISISFYSLLTITVLSILFIISCSEHNELTAPQTLSYFDDGLSQYADYIYSSIPAYGIDANQNIAQQERALIYWYNITPSDVLVQDILGDEVTVESQSNQVKTLDIVFNPSIKGIYNTGELSSDLKANWGGFFRSLPENIREKFGKKNMVMKIWINIINASPGAVLNIDLGRISEDIIPNGKLDTEDRNKNDLLEDGEDTGIDGLFDVLEPGYQNGSDPNNDDYSFQIGSGYEHVNGLENNGISIGLGSKPDTEDLNRNFMLDISNDYFSYTINLDINKISQNRIVEHGYNGWLLIKLPVDLPDLKIGSPDLNKIETFRLWITNADSQVHLRIAEIKFDEI